MSVEIRRLGRTYLNFRRRPAGNYTGRQMSAAAAYTMFSHAEFENYLEGWVIEIVNFAEVERNAGRVTRPLAHLCTFHKGTGEVTKIPQGDIWSEQFVQAIKQHREIINKNHGIKENWSYQINSIRCGIVLIRCLPFIPTCMNKILQRHVNLIQMSIPIKST